ELSRLASGGFERAIRRSTRSGLSSPRGSRPERGLADRGSPRAGSTSTSVEGFAQVCDQAVALARFGDGRGLRRLVDVAGSYPDRVDAALDAIRKALVHTNALPGDALIALTRMPDTLRAMRPGENPDIDYAHWEEVRVDCTAVKRQAFEELARRGR